MRIEAVWGEAAPRSARSTGIALVFVAFLLVATGLTRPIPVAVPVLSLQAAHAPIRIQGNANFTPENGVVGGSGTLDDPYLIAGWQIDASAANAIEIRDTTAPFVIQGVEVVHAGPGAIYYSAAYLVNVTDAALQYVNVSVGVSGFYALRSTNVSLDRVSVDSIPGVGFVGAQSRNLSVSNSSFHGGGLMSDGEGIRFVSNHAYQILVRGARDIVIDRNRVEYAGNPGLILLNWTENAIVSRNVDVGQILTGWAGGGDNTQVIGNTVSGGESGIKGYRDTNLTVSGNNVSSQSFAAIMLASSSNVTVRGNRIANSARGVYVDGVADLLLSHNDFESNLRQADVVSGQRVTWNEMYPVAGNRWSDYIGDDLCSGPRQDMCFGPDGIGDAPYVIDSNNEDFLPLMEPPPSPNPNVPPHAGLRVTPESGDTSTLFGLDASSSWDGEDPSSALEVRWDWESDGILDTAWSVGKIATHQFSYPGTYGVRVEVRDTAGLMGNTSQTVSVTLPPPAPLAASIAASPTSGTMPLTVSFTSDVTGGVPPYEYHWVFGDGSTSNAPDTVHIYITGGNFTTWLDLRDSSGTSAQSDFVWVNVTPAAVNLVVTPPTEFFADVSGITVLFSASVTGGKPPYTYHWDFGDGGQSDVQSPTHTYAANGTFAVSVTVTDARGQSVTRTFEFVVPPHSIPQSGVSLTPFVLAAAIAATAGFAVLWLNERRRGRAPPGPPKG